MNTQRVPVVIQGENFLPLTIQHIGGPRPVEVDSRFEAFLGQVALEEVVLEDAHTLRAQVPAGLVPGVYPLVLVSPLGTRVELPRAFLVSEKQLARLELSSSLDAPEVSVGQRLRLPLTVRNTGETLARAVAPSLDVRGEGQVVTLSQPAAADIAAGQDATFTWELVVTHQGLLEFNLGARGHEETLDLELEAGPLTVGPVRARRGAALRVEFGALPPLLNEGQSVTFSVSVSNDGEVLARKVLPRLVVEQGGQEVPLDARTEEDLAAGERRTVSWTYKAGPEGSRVFKARAAGQDGNSLDAVGAETRSPVIQVQRAGSLALGLTAPPSVIIGQLFAAELEVRNLGASRVRDVKPALSCGGRGQVVQVRGPEPVSTDVAGDSRTVFHWQLQAVGEGTCSFLLSASGQDATDGRLISTEVAGGTLTIGQGEVEQVLPDPFHADGTSFSYLFRYGERLYLGPRKDGRGGVRFNLNGTGGENFSFSFPRDSAGALSSNLAQAPFPSIGSTGCQANTHGCGPDNEDGRGLFFSGKVGTQEWLGIGGARSAGSLRYIYMQNTDAFLNTRFVDLKNLLGSRTKGFSAALFFRDRLYLGFPDDGGSRPYLIVLKRMPGVPGYEAQPGTDAEDLRAESMPGIGSGGTPKNTASIQMIDTLAAFNDRLYVANNGGCIRSTTATPVSHAVSKTDWAACTPSAQAWKQRNSRLPSKTANLEPADRAVPQLAVFKGRLYMARNTLEGPQLFACAPEKTAPANDCDPGDWSLVAPNTRLSDSQLTQFSNPGNQSLSLLVATAQYLYVGFDNPQGLVLLRTASAAPATEADFQGGGGCSATQHPQGCAGLSGNGLGADVTRVFQGLAVELGSTGAVYLTAGTGSGPVSVFRIVE
jgi:hypothetical protein